MSVKITQCTLPFGFKTLDSEKFLHHSFRAAFGFVGVYACFLRTFPSRASVIIHCVLSLIIECLLPDDTETSLYFVPRPPRSDSSEKQWDNCNVPPYSVQGHTFRTGEQGGGLFQPLQVIHRTEHGFPRAATVPVGWVEILRGIW